MWNVVKSQADADNLLKIFGGFHDGCIKEMKYVSGEYVNNKLGMMPFNTLRNLNVIFQRQCANPSSIEIVFSKLIRMNLSPRDEQYDDIIFGASIFVTENSITWVDTELEIDNLSDALKQEEYTWIKAKEMKWRVSDEFIGDKEIYITCL
jgi:hypothetical protein